ncbi:MAG: protein kinase domain-containing protein [Pyrinomonadaceae bacterium]
MKSLAPNSLIQNRYLIVHLIGKGGMGEVYLAVDQRLGSAVALKRTFFADDEMLGGAFEREARTLARLRHPVLPKVSDHFLEGGEQYLVMEHIAGDDLCKRLEAAQKPFPVNWVLYWADQLLDALAYLHSHEPPIIHRDIKPQNLKLTDENHIVLLDFGLAKNSTGQSRVSSGSSSGSTGSVVGYTPHYAPMEQIRGTGTSPRSDLYSLSATLYQLLTNVVPPDALTRADALLNGSQDPIVPIDVLNPEVSTAVSEVILHGMEVSQERRFANAKEMQRALRKAYTQAGEAAAPKEVASLSSADLRPVAAEPSRGVSGASSHVSMSGEEATRIRGGDSPRPVTIPDPAPPSPEFDATIRYTEPVAESPIRQSDIKTEVYQAGQIPLADIVDPQAAAHPVGLAAGGAVGTAPPAARLETAPAATDLYGAAPAESVPPAPAAPVTRVNEAEPPTPAQGRAKATQKRSRAPLAIGIIGILLVVSAAAGVAGWYVYRNLNSAATAPPEPTPMPTIEAVIPPPSDAAATGENANTETPPVVETLVPSNSVPANTSTDAAGETAATDADANVESPASAATPRRSTAARPGTPASKPAGKPKPVTSRPDIVQ